MLVAQRAYKPDYPFVFNRASPRAVGLIGSWPVGIGTKLLDITGYGRHGSLVASPTWAPGVDSGNNALVLNGTSQYVSFGALPITGDCTASVWLKTTAALSGTKLMLGNWIQGSSLNYGLFYWDSGNTNNGAEFIAANTYGAVSGSYNDGLWHLFTGTTTAAATVFYVDGKKVASSGGYSGISNTNFAWQMGAGSSQWFLGGTFEFPNVWNRALNAAEVWAGFDPRTRWDLLYKIGRKKYLLPAITAIAFDAASNSGDKTTVSSVSFAVSWTGTNRMLAIDVPFMGAAGTVSSITYGGATCTLVGAQNVVGGTGRVENWRICQNDSGAPAAGSNSLVVTYSGVIADTSVSCVSYTNVNQVTPTESWNGNSGVNSGSATDATVVVTPTSDNCWMHYGLATSQTSGIASSNTSRNIVTGVGGTGADSDGNAAVSPASAQTGRWTGNGITSAWAAAGYAIRPSTDPSNYTRPTTDAPTISESVTRIFVGLRTATDAPSISENVGRVFVGLRTTTESLSISQSVARIFVGLRTVADSLTISESATRAFIGTRTTTDSPNISESVFRILIAFRTTTDALTLSESSQRTLVAQRATTDSLSISESAKFALIGSRTAADSLVMSESASRSLAALRAATDALSLSDSVARTFVGLRSASDSLALSDIATKALVIFRTATDSLSLSDSVTAVVVSANSRTATDSLSLSENASRIFTGSRSAIESLLLFDSATVTIISPIPPAPPVPIPSTGTGGGGGGLGYLDEHWKRKIRELEKKKTIPEVKKVRKKIFMAFYLLTDDLLDAAILAKKQRMTTWRS